MSNKPITKNARIFFFFVTIFTVTFAYLFAYAVSLRVEFETKRLVDRAVPVQDMGWVRSEIDGSKVVIQGEAPSDAARFRVIEAVSQDINIKRIDDKIIAPDIDLEEPELSVEIVQNSRMSSIIGLLPKEPSPVELYYSLDRANPEITTLNLVENLESAVDESWEEKVKYLAFVVENLENVQISATEKKVTIETVVPDEETAETVKETLLAQAPAGFEVVLDVTAPRPMIAPFVFSEMTDGDNTEILECSATDEADLERIRNAFMDVDAGGFENCQLGLGAPTEDWGLLVAQLRKEVSDLGSYTLRIKDNTVHLDYSDREDPVVVEAAASRIRGSLPPGFGFEQKRIVTVKSIDELQAEGGSVVFFVKKDINGHAEISGVVASEPMKLNVESIAVAKFGSGEIDYDLDIVDNLPSAWEKNVFATINAVGQLSEGEATLTDEFVALQGVVGTDETKAQIMDSLDTELGGLSIEGQITVSQIAAQAASADPMECVDRINETLRENPIQFEPSSARISDESQTTVAAIAQILYECRRHSFEFGGHTDSKGGEDINLRISQERAEAVLDAILAQALEFGQLTAKGYGESEPIATNDTEEGRAKNRRIEIQLGN